MRSCLIIWREWRSRSVIKQHNRSTDPYASCYIYISHELSKVVSTSCQGISISDARTDQMDDVATSRKISRGSFFSGTPGEL